MANIWIFDLEKRLFSVVESKCLKKLKTKYPTIKFTLDDDGLTPTVFPSVYIHQLQGAEMNRGMVGHRVTSYLKTDTIRVTVNTNRADVEKIINTILETYRLDFNFEIVASPEIMKQGQLYIANARVRRLFDWNSAL